MTPNEFIPDYVGKMPSGAAYIEAFLLIDKTRIKTADTYRMFTFCPARINVIDKTRKAIGSMSNTKLQTLYGNFKLLMFESHRLRSLPRSGRFPAQVASVTPTRAEKI
jgi:hypothetical protein